MYEKSRATIGVSQIETLWNITSRYVLYTGTTEKRAMLDSPAFPVETSGQLYLFVICIIMSAAQESIKVPAGQVGHCQGVHREKRKTAMGTWNKECL